MKIKFLILFFIFLGQFCHAQNEFFVVNKENEAKRMRIAKGSFLRIKTADGKRYSGTLLQVKKFDIVLVAYDATIDIEEIVFLKVIYRRGATVNAMLFPAGALFNEAIGKSREQNFKMTQWSLLIKEN